jgi:hypothetical protein
MAPPDDSCSNVETAMGAQDLRADRAVLPRTAKAVPPGIDISYQHLAVTDGSRSSPGEHWGDRNCHLTHWRVTSERARCYGLLVSFPPFHRCQYIRFSLISPTSVSQKIAPRASTHSPDRFRRKTHLNSVENQGPAA